MQIPKHKITKASNKKVNEMKSEWNESKPGILIRKMENEKWTRSSWCRDDTRQREVRISAKDSTDDVFMS